jgi:hypothetical protein
MYKRKQAIVSQTRTWRFSNTPRVLMEAVHKEDEPLFHLCISLWVGVCKLPTIEIIFFNFSINITITVYLLQVHG